MVHDESALRLFHIRPKGRCESIAMALRNEEHELAQTRWSDALSAAGFRKVIPRQGSRPLGNMRFTQAQYLQLFPQISQAFEPHGTDLIQYTSVRIGGLTPY
jgi:hypothetical protein